MSKPTREQRGKRKIASESFLRALWQRTASAIDQIDPCRGVSDDALKSLVTWTPITVTELEAIVTKQLAACSPSQQAAFAACRVSFYHVPIHRLGNLESVLVVAQLPSGLLYFEDVEEGFEVGVLGEDGALPDQGCNQLDLTHVLGRAER